MHTLGCTNPDCTYQVTPEFRAATYTAFEPLYLIFHNLLQDKGRTKVSPALALWEEIAILLGVTEEKVREKWKEDKQCGDAYCMNRGPEVKTLACVRCHTIFYCGKACQKR